MVDRGGTLGAWRPRRKASIATRCGRSCRSGPISTSTSGKSRATFREKTLSGKRKKRKILLTPEERAAQEARTQELMRLIRRAEIELATGKRPPPDPSPASQPTSPRGKTRGVSPGERSSSRPVNAHRRIPRRPAARQRRPRPPPPHAGGAQDNAVVAPEESESAGLERSRSLMFPRPGKWARY